MEYPEHYLPEIGYICYEEMTRLAHYLLAHFPEVVARHRCVKTVDGVIELLETIRPAQRQEERPYAR